jgi:GNAT superfamily N-acetyltransferase
VKSRPIVATRRSEDAMTQMPAFGSVCCYLFDRRLDEPRPEPVAIHLLEVKDADAVHALHLRAIDQGVPGAVRPDSRDHFAHILGGEGQIIGLKTEQGVLVAYAVLTYRPEALPEYGAALNLPEPEWQVLACLDGISVHPAWRGNGVHTLLASWRIELARSAGKRHVCATAAPSNHISWETLTSAGLRVVNIGRFYGGMLRYVLYRDLDKPIVQPDPGSSVALSIGAIDQQRELLKAGLIGWRRWVADDRVFLVMGRPPGEG